MLQVVICVGIQVSMSYILLEIHILFIFILFYCLFVFSMAAPMAYGGSQAS